MFYPTVDNNGNTRETVSQWKGLNHNYYIADGEFYDMMNLSSDNYPIISPRQKRVTLLDVKDDDGNTIPIRGIICTDEALTYIYGKKLHWSKSQSDIDLSSYLSDGISDIQIIRMGAYLLMFPDGVYVNTADPTDYGFLGQSIAWTGTIKCEMCDADGTLLTDKYGDRFIRSDTKPSNPADDTYWFNRKEQVLECYDADTGMWLNVTTCYIRVTPSSSANLNTYFKEGDAVYMNSSVEDINNGSVIRKIADDGSWFVVYGQTHNGATQTTISSGRWIERRLPPLDHVCVSNNRVWGCHYGNRTYLEGNTEKTEFENVIYASKLGDPKNWFVYDGLSTDSYALNLGDDGCFTGAIEYQGYPTFFKENVIYRIYGQMPSNYQLVTINARGVQKGSEKSLSIVNEYLMYKSVSDICVFDGSTPTGISLPLGKGKMYFNAVAGSCLSKYYIKMDEKPGVSYTDAWKSYYDNVSSYAQDRIIFKLYSNSALTQEITPVKDSLYMDNSTGRVYKYKGIFTCDNDNDGLPPLQEPIYETRNGRRVLIGYKKTYDTVDYQEFEDVTDTFNSSDVFVYDIDYGLWYKESAASFTAFASDKTGELYAYDRMYIYGLGNHTSAEYATPIGNKTEGYVEWWCETGDQGYEYADYKYIDRLTIRAYVPITSELRVFIAYDDGDWNEVGCIREPNKTRSVSFAFSPVRCDHYRLRFQGHGDVRIYTVSRTLDTEGEDE